MDSIIENKLKLISEKDTELRNLKWSLAEDYKSLGFKPNESCVLTETHFPELDPEDKPSQFYYKPELFDLFAKKEFNFEQIELIKQGINMRLDVEKYAKIEYSYKLMMKIHDVMRAFLGQELEDRIINLILLEN